MKTNKISEIKYNGDCQQKINEKSKPYEQQEFLDSLYLLTGSTELHGTNNS